jgi:hypothetical protein
MRARWSFGLRAIASLNRTIAESKAAAVLKPGPDDTDDGSSGPDSGTLPKGMLPHQPSASVTYVIPSMARMRAKVFALSGKTRLTVAAARREATRASCSRMYAGSDVLPASGACISRWSTAWRVTNVSPWYSSSVRLPEELRNESSPSPLYPPANCRIAPATRNCTDCGLSTCSGVTRAGSGASRISSMSQAASGSASAPTARSRGRGRSPFRRE